MPSKHVKTVSLTAELDDFVSRKVNSGRYRSASEVVREALRLLERQEVRAEERSPVRKTPVTRGGHAG